MQGRTALLFILLLGVTCQSWADLPIDSTEDKAVWDVEWQFGAAPIPDLAGLLVFQNNVEIFRTTDSEQRTATITVQLTGRDAFEAGEYDTSGQIHRAGWSTPFWVDPPPPPPAELTMIEAYDDPALWQWSPWTEPRTFEIVE